MTAIRDVCVKPDGEAIILNEMGAVIVRGVLSKPSLMALHLQILGALLRGEDLAWSKIEDPEN